MKDESTLPQRKLRLLGNILLVLACLGILLALLIATVGIFEPAPTTLFDDPESAGLMEELDPESRKMIDELFLPEGVTLETTVRELVEKDRTFYEKNHSTFITLSFLSAAFVLLSAVIFLRLALAWRKAVPFGRAAILGLRFLGLLLVIQFVVGSVVAILIPDPWHRDLFLLSELSHSPVDFFIGGGPILSSGILFLILSWVLDYGRQIKEEQALTI